ncbi:MAG: NAD-binding protein [Planctomycetia bacterium]|nr:NAD-binding protein [Planctomycetia bacterium]
MKHNPLARIRRGAIALVVIFALAVCGYHYLAPPAERDWLSDTYLVMITLATIGFGEKSQFDPARQIWTMVVIIVGLTASGYTIGGLFQLLLAGEIDRALGVRRMTRDINRLVGHVIICGFGRVGRILAEQLERQRQPFVIIDTKAELTQEAQDLGYLVITSDAMEESALNAAGIDRARVLVTALPADADNVFLTLTARNLNSKLWIIARGEQPGTQKKLRQAGANRAVMTAAIGARWIASMITRPSTVEFLELVSDTETLDAVLDEIVLQASHRLVGRSVGEVVADWPHTMLIVAVKGASGQMTFRPDPGYALAAGDTLILLGEGEAIRQFRLSEGI